MKRKIISLILTLAMLISLISIATVSMAKQIEKNSKLLEKPFKSQKTISVQYMKQTKTFDNPNAIPDFIVFQNYILRKNGETKKLEINKTEKVRLEKVFENVYDIPDTITIDYKGQQVTLTKTGVPFTRTAQEVTLNADGSYTTKTIKYCVQLYEGNVDIKNVVYMQDYAGYVIMDGKFHIFKK